MNDFREYSSYTSVYSGQIPSYSDYLAHHGILGMHWGIRRYQNKDGSLTTEGKKRYGNVENLEKWKDTVDSGRKAGMRGGSTLGLGAGIVGGHLAGPLGGFAGGALGTAAGLAIGSAVGGAVAKSKANKQLKEDLNKGDKNTPNKEVSEYIARKTDEANKINLEKVRNSALTDEIKDKWQRAAETDKFDLDFLEHTQNNYNDMPEDATRKQMLKDYKDYLNCKHVHDMAIDKHKDSKELDEAADLGLKALKKIDPGFNDSEGGDDDQESRDWFNYEDQTIGYTEVADLCKKSYKSHNGDTKTARAEVNQMIDSLKDNKMREYFKGKSEALFDLEDFAYGVDDDYRRKYMSAIFAILQAEGKIQHSAVEEVFQKFGII
jgi:outer membrane lipoprotein SlyB